MPQDVLPATPTDVLPAFLCSAFSFDLRFESIDNRYPDGQSDRAALAANPRRFFRLTHKLTGPQWQTLRDFYRAHVGIPFYFYVLRETIPPWTADPTGQAPDGRYAVVFDGGWTETIGIGRAEASLGLRQVQEESQRGR
jgi:hypothetical protein